MSTPIVSMQNMDESKRGLDPLVSIVIPCYMQAHFLREAIETSLSQTYKHIEVIVVDDGSPDYTAAVAASYDQVIFVRQENQGISAARNRGLEESTGEYIVFLDSDDRLKATAIESGMKQLIARPNAAFVYGRCDLINSEGSFLYLCKQPKVDSDHYRHMLTRNIITGISAILFRREALDAVGGFRCELNGAEDYDLYLRLTRAYEVCCYDEVVSEYRQHEASMSHKAHLVSRAVHDVLHKQVPYVSENKAYRKALKKGIRYWRRNHYATSLIVRVNENARNRRLKAIVPDVLSLLRANPQLLLENAFRKIRLQLKQLSSKGLWSKTAE